MTDTELFERFAAFTPDAAGELNEMLGELRERKIESLKPETTRKCLKCDKDFESQGPDNRLCPRCRKGNSKMAAGVVHWLDEGGL